MNNISAKNDIKLGLIGGGYWGQNLIREFNAIGILHTICEINSQIIKKYQIQYPNIQITTDWNNILKNQNINAVCISLPAEMHYKFAKEALEHDKDVYIEKPITLSLSEAQDLIDLSIAKNKILMVGHLLHYHAGISKIKEIIKSGEIGRIKNIISNRLNLGKFRTSENVLWSFAPHDISVILSLCNDKLPDTINCQGQATLTQGIHDITNTTFKYEKENIYVNINVNWLNPYKEQKLVIIGEKGMIEFDDVKPQDKLLLYKDYLQWSKTLPASPEPIKNQPLSIEYDNSLSPLTRECLHFVECCQKRQRPITNGQEGLQVLQVLEMAQLSLENNGQTINIKEELFKMPDLFTKIEYWAHESATIDPEANIGKGSKIWHYTHVCSGADIGENCSLGQNVFVAKGSKLGNNCRVQNNVSVYSGVICEENVFLGPSCVFTNDKNPRVEYSKNGNYSTTYIEEGASIGANVTIVCGTRLGKYCLIGAGAVVTKDVKPYSVMVGNPAKKIGTITKDGQITKF